MKEKLNLFRRIKKKRQGKRRMKRKLDKEEKNWMKEKLIRFK